MHRFSTRYDGDSAAALKTAQQLMADRGFSVSKISGGEVRGSRTHPFSGGKTSDMIAVVSELVIRVSASQISAEAELGTLKKLMVFLLVMIVGMEAMFLAIGLVATHDRMMMWISLITVAPWVFIGPAMMYGFRRMALGEVQKLVENVAAMTERG